MFLTEQDEAWVLDYLSSGKEMIPYQMITEDFFQKKDFYSELKEKDISDEEYQNVKNVFMLFRLKTLGDMRQNLQFSRYLDFMRNF